MKSADLVVKPLEKALDGDPNALKEYELYGTKHSLIGHARQREIRKSLDALTDRK